MSAFTITAKLMPKLRIINVTFCVLGPYAVFLKFLFWKYLRKLQKCHYFCDSLLFRS